MNTLTARQPASTVHVPQTHHAQHLGGVIRRVRSEFAEMPCLRLTLSQAERLFGLPSDQCMAVFERLSASGFLVSTNGVFRRSTKH